MTYNGCLPKGDQFASSFLDVSRAVDRWAISDNTLRLSAPDGSALTFALWPDTYPGNDTPLVQGQRNVADYRFGYIRSGSDIRLTYGWRAPDAWHRWAVWGDVRADSTQTPTLEPGCFPGDTRTYASFVLGFASAEATRVLYQADGGEPITLPLYALPDGGTLQAFGGFVERAGSEATITVYRNDQVLAQKHLNFARVCS